MENVVKGVISPPHGLKVTLGNDTHISGAVSTASRLNALFGNSKIVVNDYLLTVSDIDGGARLTVQRGGEVQEMDIFDGEQGYSPVVSVEKIEDGHRVTITDKNGSKSFDVLNGVGVSDDGEINIATRDRLGVVRAGNNLNIDEKGILSVDTASDVEQDNTRPITSAAVHTTVGNIEILLATI